MVKCEGINIKLNSMQGNIAVNRPAKVNILPAGSFKNDLFVKSTNNNSLPSVTTYPAKPAYTSRQKLDSILNKNYINFLISTNPELKDMLDKNNLNEINLNNVSKIKNTHLMTTLVYARQIATQMGLSAADKQILEEACMLHDIGKIFIPKSIIDKPGILSSDEKKVMSMHAELGYQLLKNTGINKRTLELIRNHHKPYTENCDKIQQILSVADIYSALREERAYKTSLTNKETLEILDQKAENGEVSAEVVDALKASVLSVK